MTAPDIAGLCERLRRLKPVLSTPQHGGWVGQPRNPDGPEAADTLERQAAELARMREALETIAESHDAGRHDGLPEDSPAHDAETMFAIARATLTGEDA